MTKRKRFGLLPVNPEGWLMSYADMVTILLALFIVLSTLGKDQTGVSLQEGLESFRESRATFGAGGLFDRSARGIQHEATGPRYLTEGSEEEKDQADRVNDLEQEQLQRFLGEMDRQFRVEKLPQAVGQATVDLFTPLNRKAPYLTATHADFLTQLLPVLERTNYRVTLIVWAPTPSETAWGRAAGQARAVADELLAGASTAARARLIAVGQSWPYATFRRPVMSVVIARLAEP
jgi:hypothetical protein